MENKLKHRFSRIFQTSLTSCRQTKNISDVIDQPFFFPENQHHRQLIDLFSPKPQPFSFLICKPKLSEPHHAHEKRSKVSEGNPLLVVDSPAKEIHNAGRKCLPVSPTTPLNNNIFYQTKSKKTRNRKTRLRKTYRKRQTNEFFASITAKYYGSSCYSSDEDEDDAEYDDETTLFSSRSLSSDSSESFRKHKARLADKKAKRTGRNNTEANGNAKSARVVPVEGNGRVTESFALVKKSSDPHNDFRTSMVEMIVEKQIFGAQELENLLQCYLSLNSDQHHMVIVEVFTEILETLFSDSC